MSFWVPLWWRQQMIVNKLILLALPALLPVMLLLVGWQVRRKRFPQAKSFLVTLLFAWIGVAFWFMLAPAFRFGYGFLFATLALLALPLAWEVAVRAGAPLLASLLSLLVSAAMVGSLLVMEYHHYRVPASLTQAEYATLLQRMTTPEERRQLRAQFPNAENGVFQEKQNRSLVERVRLMALLSTKGDVNGKTGFEVPMVEPNGEGGLLSLPRRMIRPAAYPLIEVQPLPMGKLAMLQNTAEKIPWYAPYPFVVRTRLCYPLGPQLSDGFGPVIVPTIRDWHKEARW